MYSGCLKVIHESKLIMKKTLFSGQKHAVQHPVEEIQPSAALPTTLPEAYLPPHQEGHEKAAVRTEDWKQDGAHLCQTKHG